MNVFSFTGNLGNQAEQRYTQGGDSIVSFSVAVKSGFGDKAVTTWVRCTMFGKRGESVLPYLNKGQLVGVSGEFSAREWDDKEGQKRTSVEVRVNDLTLLGGKSDSANTPAQKAPDSANSHKPKPQFDDLGDDCPF
jgi:single-strand DNA-binding protein